MKACGSRHEGIHRGGREEAGQDRDPTRHSVDPHLGHVARCTEDDEANVEVDRREATDQKQRRSAPRPLTGLELWGGMGCLHRHAPHQQDRAEREREQRGCCEKPDGPGGEKREPRTDSPASTNAKSTAGATIVSGTRERTTWPSAWSVDSLTVDNASKGKS